MMAALAAIVTLALFSAAFLIVVALLSALGGPPDTPTDDQRWIQP